VTTNPVLEVTAATSRAPDGTSLLDDVSFAVEPGWLVAVVGPTGAGKTSLARAILGQLSLTAGTIRVTGRDQDAGSGYGRVGGVPQEDATHPQLSLRRTLEHAAALRGDAGAAQRRHRVDAVLAELGLTGRSGTRLSHLSGGERKRANVAVELTGQPDLLVLDEPTAGLDPGFEKSVFANLRSLADTGRTIVAITHSVRVLAVCDRVLFLAPGGVVAFFGTPADAQAYFDWDDPADAYAALATEPTNAWKARFAAHLARAAQRSVRAEGGSPASLIRPGMTVPDWRRPTPANPPAWSRTGSALPSGTTRSRSGHLRTLLHRAVHLASSDRRTLGLSLAAGPVLGLLLWAVLPGGTLRPPTGPDGETAASAPKAAIFAFFLGMTITWLGAAGAAREVVKERHILRRELGAGVSLSTYLAGKALFLSALTALQALPLAAIAVLHQDAPSRGPALGSGFLEVMAVAVLVGVAAVATGLLVSSWASSSEKAMTVLPMVLIAQLALAGPWAEHRGVILDLFRYLVPARWAAAAVTATVVGDAPGWWLAVLCLAGLVVLQLGAAFALLQRSSPSLDRRQGEGLRALSNRLTIARPSAIQLVPVGLALVLALAAGAGAVGRAGRGIPSPEALAPPIAPPTTLAVAKVVTAPSPRTAVTAPAPVPAPPITTRAVLVPTTSARTPTTVVPRQTTPAPTAPPTNQPPTPPTTSRPTTPTTTPTAATSNPFALQTWILQQVFQPQPRR